jgi:uncharacterized membrane protein
MVSIDTVRSRNGFDLCRIVARPNHSASWAGNKLLIALLATWSGALSLFFLALGLWPVVPFLGLEVAAVAIGLYAVCWKLQQRHVLHISRDGIELQKGHYQPQFSRHFAPGTLSLSVELPDHPWDPPRLYLCSDGERIAIGDFLNKEESRQLLGLLRERLPVRNHSRVVRAEL